MQEHFEFVEKLKAEVGPMGVSVVMKEVNGVFYLELDGTSTYPDAKEWIDNWGVDFAGWTRWYVSKHYRSRKPKSLTGTKVKYKIGTIMDILKDVD